MKNPEILKTKKLFLTSRASFKDIREQGAVYVDKTKQIYDCIGKDVYYFLARPRRFGKSILCRTLEQLFLGNRPLFKGLWIDKSDWLWKKHPVIYLDMSKVAGGETTTKEFRKVICKRFQKIAHEYDVTIDPTDTPQEQLSDLIEFVSAKYNLGAVVIIDEYDKPILDLIAAGKPYKAMHNLLSTLYAQLKPAEEYLRFVFITGVFKFTQTSIFSKLNNLNDLTFAHQAGDLVGYTQEELEHNFSEEIDLLAAKESLDKAAMLEKLRAEYNGYCFGIDVSSEKLSPSVYNPYAINHTFFANQMVQKWFASGSPSFLIQKIKEGNFEVIDPNGCLVNFGDLATSCDPSAVNALSLLYYTGYATLAEYTKGIDEVRLVYPNEEVARATASHLVALFQNTTSSTLLRIAWNIGEAFRNNKLALVEDLLEQAFAQLTYQIFVSKEKYFQSMIMLILMMGKLRVEAEVATSLGRADLIVYLANRIFIIETKFNKPAKNGLDQIKDRSYMNKFLVAQLPIEAVGISVNLKKEKKKKLFEVVWENIAKDKSATKRK